MPTRGRTFNAPAPSRGSRVIAVVLIIGVIAALAIGLPALFSGFTKTQGGEIAVIRNGGPFDNNQIRQVIQPASSLTWIGTYSVKHRYPAQQRFYTITAQADRGDRTGVDVERLPTADGV